MGTVGWKGGASGSFRLTEHMRSLPWPQWEAEIQAMSDKSPSIAALGKGHFFFVCNSTLLQLSTVVMRLFCPGRCLWPWKDLHRLAAAQGNFPNNCQAATRTEPWRSSSLPYSGHHPNQLGFWFFKNKTIVTLKFSLLPSVEKFYPRLK